LSPKIIADVNDVYVKLAKIKGQDVPWHTHDDEDELFYVMKGRMRMEMRGGHSFDMTEGEPYITNNTTDTVFVRAIDDVSDSKTGTINYFAATHLAWNSTGPLSTTAPTPT